MERIKFIEVLTMMHRFAFQLICHLIQEAAANELEALFIRLHLLKILRIFVIDVLNEDLKFFFFHHADQMIYILN